ncbi:uncharacterized protein FIBRA_05655 [Fibroporia radiculosa]|uniref:BTB domain-containing protein n=1 Tax=Fibroporia radiculosa TaxID=599839 RepID=J4IAU5_9APHY|nr:uncharacterized protein FIBRA_05655 [Fibroporia radiculosa]CCM03521.1 predicted protein [Fibroporia radiculosa]
MYPISDLTAFCRRTTGDVPPKLVGASTTVVGSKMYLYGGRLVSERKMVSDIYMFDLETFRWDRLHQHLEDDVPQARYFHSADTWRNHLIIFGGMAIRPHSDNPEDLCVLNDVRMFNLTTGHWLPSSSTASEGSPPSFIPNARYAHLSSVSADRLFVIGGQDLANVWLDDVYVYDLAAKAWVLRREYSRHCGTYRSVAVTADMRVRLPQEELRAAQPSSSGLGPAGNRFKVNQAAPTASVIPTASITQSESLVYLPYSAPPTDDYPCDIFLFSNYNFTDVQRELEVFSPLSDGDFTVSDRSGSMNGTSFPPGLRFPTGAILGTYFIVAGTYLSQTYQSFSIWALDLINMTWARIDPGSALSTGSWFRSCLWPAENKFMVFGNRHGNLVEDYNRRLLSWDHVTCIDLEAFGIYQSPPMVLDIRAQELGLATLEESVLADFEIICDDGRKVQCSRKVLEERWPWFRAQLRMFVQSASQVAESMPMVPQHVALPELSSTYGRQEQRLDPRLTPRSFHLSEPYPITLALVQYFYSMALITPLQHAPAVLSQLLLLSSTYELNHLQSLVKHAMHRALSYATSVGIYGVATLCNCRSLQIRALRIVMAYSQKRPAGGRSRTDRDGSSGSRNHDNTNGSGADRSGTGGSGGGSSSEAHAAARPRGMSDASYLRGPSDGSGSSFRDSPTPTALVRSDVSSTSMSRPRAMSEVATVQSHLPSHSVEVHDLREKSMMTTAYRNGQVLAHASSDSFSLCPRDSDPAQKSMVSRSKAVARERSDSITSLSTDRELSALVELISPTGVDDDEQSVASSRGPRLRASSSSLLDVYRSSEARCAGGVDSRTSLSLSTSSAAGSLYADSDTECFSDAFCDAAVFSPTQATYPAFHLPLSPRLRSHRDHDTPSLKTSTSLSSLSTPSLSRTSSFHRSPPVSPTSLALATPVDVAASFSHGAHPLQVIEEARLPEDAEGSQELYGDERATASLPSLGSEPLHVATPLARGSSHGPILQRPRSSSKIVNDREDAHVRLASPDTIVPNMPSRSSSVYTPKTPPLLKSPRGVKVFARLFAKEKPIVDEPSYEHLSNFNDLALSLSLDKAEERKARNKEIRAEKLALQKSLAALASQID